MSFFDFWGGGSQKSLFSSATVDWDFAKQKNLLTKKGESLITFSRASSATYYGADGVLQIAAVNEPRFGHNPTTRESLGLLVEEQRTNLLLRSEEFDNASWTKIRTSVTADSVIAPNGTQTADKIIEDATASATHYVSVGAGMVAGNTYTYSVYARAAERNWIILSPGGTWGYAWFNILSGAIGTVTSGGSNATAAIQPVGNGWYRCSVTATAVESRGLQILVTTGNNVVVYTGDGTSGVHLWGAQLEAGSFPTSYIPTAAGSVTRAADAVSVTGSNFSSWYRQDEGTIFSAFSIPTSSTAAGARVYAFSNSGGTTQTWLRLQGGTNRVYEVTNLSSQQAVLSAGTFSAGVLYKGAVAIKTNDFGFSENGSTPTTDTSGTLGTVDRLGIGVDAGGAAPLNGTISRLTYWPTRLSNTTLQRVTR